MINNEDQNWTTNQDLIAISDELDVLIERLNAIGETRFGAILQAVSIARVIDGDGPADILRRFDSLAVNITMAAMQ